MPKPYAKPPKQPDKPKGPPTNFGKSPREVVAQTVSYGLATRGHISIVQRQIEILRNHQSETDHEVLKRLSDVLRCDYEYNRMTGEARFFEYR
jgi:hypothetical protein